MNRLLLLTVLCAPLMAQESTAGVAVPFTLTGGILRTNGLGQQNPGSGDVSVAYRALFHPTLKLGPKWFVYSAIQLSSAQGSYYGPSEYGSSNLDWRVIQAFVGRTWTAPKATVTVKVGQLASAFGSFPLRYDDMANPLLDEPLAYRSLVRIRTDELPCGVTDLASQWSSYQGGVLPSVRFGCGGEISVNPGIQPITLYGLPGAEAEITAGRMDARVQLTNSSPASPQNIRSPNQHAQWTAGAGYTIRQGFRIGVSAFRGPYLENQLNDLLPAGDTVRSYPASGLGIDVQWAKGHWSAEGEWQRFQFDYPGFITSPAVSFGYVELKTILTPRFYAAARLGYQGYHAVQDERITSSNPFLEGRRSYEFAVGYRPNRWQLLKAGYQRLRLEGGAGIYDNQIGLQLVTSIQSLAKSYR